MLTSAWIALTVGALMVGVAAVSALAAPRRFEIWSGIAAVSALALTAWGSVSITTAFQRVDITIYTALFGLAAFAGGYGLASAYLSGLRRRLPKVALPDPLPPERQGTVALFVTCAEPGTYDPFSTAGDLEEIAVEGGPEHSVGITPFLYAAQKARYRAIDGTSPAADEVRAIMKRVRSLLDTDEYPVVDAVWCLGHRSLDAMIAQAANQGYRRFVIVGLSVAEAFHIDKAKCAVDVLKPHLAGLQVVYAPPLWASEQLAQLVANRILNATEDPSVTGVALVAHGQPEAREQSHRAFDAQEQSFINRVRLILLENHIEGHLIRTAWADWRDPNITETVRHLAALGASKVLISPACHPVDCISTLLDFPMAVRQSRVDPQIRTLQMGAWGDQPEVAEALVTAVQDTARELDD